MKKRFTEKLESSNRIHVPLSVDEEEYAEYSIRRKKEMAAQKLSDCENLEYWKVDEPARMEMSNEFSENGETSIKFTSPTRLPKWKENYARIYATPCLSCLIPEMDMSEYNRIAISIRPEMQGFKHVSLYLQLVNEGAHPIPDRYMREGCHNINLKNHKWNQVNVEIPNVYRDRVTAIKVGYDMVGNEREATDTACFYIKDIEIQKVDVCEKYEGWEPKSGKLMFSGSGYQSTARKMAFGAAGCSESFHVVETGTGRVILEKKVKRIKNEQGAFSVLDFSEIEEPGTYLLVCGSIITRTFEIGDAIWEDSLWKCINLFYCERCGYEVPGVHKYCHGNVVSHYKDKSVVSNGGWHDAADMSQNLTNTADAAYTLFRAAEEQRQNKELFTRLIEEAKWGLDWLLRTRFENGYRTTGSGGSVWTGNIQGECDQIDNDAQRLAIENFMASGAEALGARVLGDIDKEQSQYLIQVAKEDWKYAYEDIDQEQYVATMDPARVSSPLLLYSMGVISACELYRVTQDTYYAKKAEEIAERMMGCQQKEYPEWEIPLTGFFYRDSEKTQVQHYNHRCYEHSPVMALELLLENFLESPRRMEWYHSLLLYTEYLKEAVKITAPYHMAPATIYHEGEAEQDRKLFLEQQAFAHEGMLGEYKEQVENGVALGKGYYLKRFPVWFSYRGNNGLILSSGSAAAAGSRVRNNIELQQLALHQLEWIVGKNPFGQSLMIGEGYEYADQYLCLPGEISGGICVGIQSFSNSESPYWPQCNNAVYRELWVHPSIRYLLLASRLQGNAKVVGCLKGEEKKVTFQRAGSKTCCEASIESVSGHFEIELPAGEYKIIWGNKEKMVTLVNKKRYEISDNFSCLEAEYEVKGKEVCVTVRGKGEGKCHLAFMTDNIEMEQQTSIMAGECKVYKGKIINQKCPWLITIVPNENQNEKIDLYQKTKVGRGDE